VRARSQSNWRNCIRPVDKTEKGERGERGPKGDAGASGGTIRDWKIDRARYVATPLMSDGSDGPPLELRGLFEQFLLETRHDFKNHYISREGGMG
jgi:hypothetical protein